MSETDAPSRSTCFTFEFMNTVQRVPKSHGDGARQAARQRPRPYYPGIGRTCDERAAAGRAGSFTSMRVIAPLSANMAFMSCPPISRTNETCCSMFLAAI